MATDSKEASGFTQPGWLSSLNTVDHHIQRVEVAACVVVLGLMALLAFSQVFLRQVSGASLGPIRFPDPVPWFDLVGRYLVIWVGLLGASLATAEGRHISIEAAPKLLSHGGRRRLEVFVNAVSLGVCFLLLVISIIYMVKIRYPEPQPLFFIDALGWKVYSWRLLIVVPIALAVICWRFGLRLVEGCVLDDETFIERREGPAEHEIYELEAKVQEDQEVNLLLETARRCAEEHGAPDLDEDSARAHVREVLKSDRVVVEQIREEIESARAVAVEEAAPKPPVEDVDDLGEESEDDHPPLPDPAADEPKPPQPRRLSFKSTDEIPVYRDPSDDEDLLEPEHQTGAAPVLDSSDELDSMSGMEDLMRSAEEMERMSAPTDRVPPPKLDEDSLEQPTSAQHTERLAVETPASESTEDAHQPGADEDDSGKDEA